MDSRFDKIVKHCYKSSTKRIRLKVEGMGYYIDLEKISIDDYKVRLELVYLPPSKMVLKEKLDERFGYFI